MDGKPVTLLPKEQFQCCRTRQSMLSYPALVHRDLEIFAKPKWPKKRVVFPSVETELACFLDPHPVSGFLYCFPEDSGADMERQQQYLYHGSHNHSKDCGTHLWKWHHLVREKPCKMTPLRFIHTWFENDVLFWWFTGNYWSLSLEG